jgi:hypothetical protein
MIQFPPRLNDDIMASRQVENKDPSGIDVALPRKEAERKQSVAI